MAELHPWNRQQGETSKAYEAFSIYRDLGPERSVRRVSEQLAKTQTVIKRWSAKYDWVERVAAWDSVPSQAVADAYADMATATVAKHRALADKLLAKLDRSLDALPEGADPSIRWSTAHGAAVKSHALALDTAKPETRASDEINDAIRNLLNKLAGG